MGAQLSVVAHNKCGCAHTCYWFLELLIYIPGGISKFLFLCMFFVYKKRKEKTKRKQRKEIKGV